MYFAVYATNRHGAAREPIRHDATAEGRETVRDLRSIAAVLFGLLLFFQFGSEWAIAGWLPLFLIHRLGSNPEWAIFALAIYFADLLLGRLLAFRLLPRFEHRKLLLASTILAMLGYLFLSFTTSLLGAYIAIILIGAGFAPVYPLIAENLDERFSYRPDFYNRMLLSGVTGAMSMQWILGFVGSYTGMQYVMLIPALGSIAVLILTLLIMLEAHLMGSKIKDRKQENAVTASKE